VVKEELLELRAKFADARRTEIRADEGDSTSRTSSRSRTSSSP
jgi:DNA gyrase/topoisomerase IV subunit A